MVVPLLEFYFLYQAVRVSVSLLSSSDVAIALIESDKIWVINNCSLMGAVIRLKSSTSFRSLVSVAHCCKSDVNLSTFASCNSGVVGNVSY